MKREEYMGALQGALTEFDEELVQEIVNDYEERFRVGFQKGKTEEQIIRELGSIKDLVDELGELQQSSKESFQTAGQKNDGTAEVNRGENMAEDPVQDTENMESNENFDNNQSGTYYQEKSFAESFDSAMKKFGKALDSVMKEAGRVIEGAAEQFEMHMEEARKNHYYTYNGDGTCEGSERDMEGEPNVEQSGQGSEGCRRVVVDADIADVKIRTTKESEPRAVCHYYSHKTAMMYPFYARQEGDTFYVGVRRNQDSEKKSGFFQFSMSPSIEIELMLPEGVVLLEASGTCGDMELNEVSAEELALRTKSGDINASYLVCDRISMEAMSGDLELVKSVAKTVTLTTKSGDCKVDRIEGVEGVASLVVRTASGDADVKSVQAANIEVNTASGDVSADALQGISTRFHTASGEIRVNDCRGECLEAGSASGDIRIRADYKRYIVKSQSGEIALESRHDADVTANSTSGDVEIRFVEALETYQITTHSVSGEATISGQTGSESIEPTRTIDAKTISGDIQIRFL